MSPKPGKHKAKARAQAKRRKVAQAGAQTTATAQPAPVVSAPQHPAQTTSATRRFSPAKAPPKMDYIKGDLKRIAATAGAIVVIIVVLSLALK